MRGPLARIRQRAFHAAAHVEEQADAHAGQIDSKIRDRPGLAPVEDLEVTRGQVLDKAALVIPDDRRDAHEVDAGSKRGYWSLCPQCHRANANNHRQTHSYSGEFSQRHPAWCTTRLLPIINLLILLYLFMKM